MTRGGLIFPVWAEIAPFTGAVAEDPDFHEPTRLETPDGLGQAAPTHGPSYRLPCQVEMDAGGATNMQPNGDAPRHLMHLVFLQSDLTKFGIAPKPRDFLLAIYSRQGELLQSYQDGPQLMATEAKPLGFGLFRGRTKLNLLRVTFQDRNRGVRRAA